MRHLLIVLSMLFLPLASAHADVGFAYSAPGVRIGINLPAYPRLVRIPGYPVYYDPYVRENYFFYDGLYWVFYDDRWYASSWYNGPWRLVDIYDVPAFILRIPVRYYRRPPVYFRGWRRDASPRWGEHWGREWERRRGDWDHWNRRSVPAAAPLPSYQRHYRGRRYPANEERQHAIRSERYRYQPREPVTRRYDEKRRGRQDGERQDRHEEHRRDHR